MSTGTQTEVVMPQMGVSVSEGTVTRWLKQVGEAIARDEPLLEISTDKVDTEVPSPAEGVLSQILVQEGETVEVGTVIAIVAPAGAPAAPPAPARSAPAAAHSRTARSPSRPQCSSPYRTADRPHAETPRRQIAPGPGDSGRRPPSHDRAASLCNTDVAAMAAWHVTFHETLTTK